MSCRSTSSEQLVCPDTQRNPHLYPVYPPYTMYPWRCRRGRVPNFHFTFTLNNGDIWDITFTAVRGHVMEHVFPDACKSWQKYPMKQLFETPVRKQVSPVRSSAQPFFTGRAYTNDRTLCLSVSL